MHPSAVIRRHVSSALERGQRSRSSSAVRTSEGRLKSVMTSKPPAPAALLQIVRCNCQTDCSSRRFKCRSNGLECSPSCGQCKGTGCTNSGTLSEEDADDAIE